MNGNSEVSSKMLNKARRSALRTRAASACRTCKDKKLKCSGFRPCTRCAKYPGRQECVFDSTVKRDPSNINCPALDEQKTLPLFDSVSFNPFTEMYVPATVAAPTGIYDMSRFMQEADVKNDEYVNCYPNDHLAHVQNQQSKTMTTPFTNNQHNQHQDMCTFNCFALENSANYGYRDPFNNTNELDRHRSYESSRFYPSANAWNFDPHGARVQLMCSESMSNTITTNYPQGRFSVEHRFSAAVPGYLYKVPGDGCRISGSICKDASEMTMTPSHSSELPRSSSELPRSPGQLSSALWTEMPHLTTQPLPMISGACYTRSPLAQPQPYKVMRLKGLKGLNDVND
jgi:hypothetical protein